MESQENRDEQPEGVEAPPAETPEEFAEKVENDPSTASSGEDELEQVRGG